MISREEATVIKRLEEQMQKTLTYMGKYELRTCDYKDYAESIKSLAEAVFILKQSGVIK